MALSTSNQPFGRSSNLTAEAAQVLGCIRVLDGHYGPIIAEQDADLARALTEATAALERFVVHRPDAHPVPAADAAGLPCGNERCDGG